jgi:hypothetical protein
LRKVARRIPNRPSPDQTCARSSCAGAPAAVPVNSP